MNFIYVFSEENRDTLLAMGLNMIKGDGIQRIYIFENPKRMTFSMPDISYVLSDKLTF